jgi:uncharacterized protein YegL
MLSTYNVTTVVNSRLAKTTIAMEFDNLQNCSTTYALTLQLPRNARLTDLTMELSDGCELTSDVKTLSKATDDFEHQVSQGKPAALLTACNMNNYQLQVSLRPNRTTIVELHYEELLWKKLHQVEFQVPLFPGIAVDRLFMDISVQNSNTGMLGFRVEDFEDDIVHVTLGGNSSSAHYEGIQVSEESALPRLLRAFYEPGPLPDEGLLLYDGECFTHLFNPSTFLAFAGTMARNIVFVIDVSGSMTGQKLEDAKAAFAAMIDTLEEKDTLLVQTFSDKGTEDLWGPNAATTGAKESAASFVESLHTIGGTNLNQAYLDGISLVYQSESEVVPILVILTDGQGNKGPKEVARNVLAANGGGKVKIFALAFGDNADMDLLLGISIQNGGRTVRIYEGFGDAVTQMETFYRSELGAILLSDIDVVYEGDNIQLVQSTQSRFPVLADGSEIVVRGKIESSLTSVTREDETPKLHSVISALSAVGAQSWSTEHAIEPLQLALPIGECQQSFAQARILELLEYRDAERALGDELFGSNTRRVLSTSTFEEQAQELALEAGLVWPGLTAMVTIENDRCASVSEVCYDGEGDGGSDSGFVSEREADEGLVSGSCTSCFGLTQQTSDSKRMFSFGSVIALAVVTWCATMTLAF